MKLPHPLFLLPTIMCAVMIAFVSQNRYRAGYEWQKPSRELEDK